MVYQLYNLKVYFFLLTNKIGNNSLLSTLLKKFTAKLDKEAGNNK